MRFVAPLLALALLFSSCRGGSAQNDGDSDPKKGANGAAEDAQKDSGEGGEPNPLADLESRSFPLLLWASVAVSREYVHEDRLDPRSQLVSATESIGRHTPEFFATANGDALDVTVRAATRQFSLTGLGSLFDAAERLETILEFTQSVLNLEEEPLHELEYAAINGMLLPLDPHTVLLTPEQHTDLGVKTRGQFGGIGAEIRAESRRIRVVRVIPEGPAEKAGVQDGDLILKIDRESTINMSVVDAQQKLRGPVGEPVGVSLQRGTDVVKAKIVRAIIKIDAVEHTRLPGDVGYVSVATFQEDTGEKVSQAIQTMAGQQKLAGLVLDLRANSGGLLTQATKMLDLFVKQGELVVVRSAAGREADPATEATVVPADLPVVVLVDEESASASEIVSGGLKELGRGIVVGRTSFGKGTVQMLKPAAPYGRELALKLTVAEYLLAGDRSIQSTGVVPDVALYPVELSSQFPGIARMFDAERFERSRERFRAAHLPSNQKSAVPPATPAPRQIRYLWSTEPNPGSEGSLGPDTPPEMRDPEIRMARRIALGVAGDPDPTKALGRVVDSLSLEEADRTSAALKKQKIEWGTEPKAQVPLALKLSLGDAKVQAGEPFELQLEIQNTGTEPVTRVHAITDCVHDELDGIELLVGTVAPGETIRRQLALQVMPWQTGFTDEIRVDLHAGEPGDKPDATGSVRFDVEDLAPPELAFDYWIVDDPRLAKAAPARPDTRPIPGEPPFEVAGNGDGLLQPGERVLLAVQARNVGKAKSPDARVILRNLTGSQGLLEEGLLVLGPIAPGKMATGAFGISINADARADLPFEVELILGDALRRVSVSDKLRFRLGPPGTTYEAASTQIEVGAEPLRLYAGAHGKSRVVAEIPPGTKLAAAGKLGAFYVVERGLTGRRLFLPADRPAVAEPTRRPVHQLDPDILRYAVAPPHIELDAVPSVVSGGEVVISGRAYQSDRVRDVVVSVEQVGPAALDTKVHYLANPSTTGESAGTLAFETRVPLQPGANRITVVARDGAKVSRRRDVAVFRP